MQTQGRRRGFKSWFVEPYRQVRLGLVFLVINLIFSALIVSIFGYYVLDVYKALETYFQLSGAQGAEILAKLRTPLLVGGGLIAVFVISTILASVRYTHEIYGPLVSIHRYLDDILIGRISRPLQLRESDQLKELANKLNQLAEVSLSDQRRLALVPFHKVLDDLLANKSPEPIRLRENDQLQAFASKFNQLTEKLRRVP